eukprot:768523-Hanusia_phi.AAC.12
MLSCGLVGEEHDPIAGGYLDCRQQMLVSCSYHLLQLTWTRDLRGSPDNLNADADWRAVAAGGAGPRLEAQRKPPSDVVLDGIAVNLSPSEDANSPLSDVARPSLYLLDHVTSRLVRLARISHLSLPTRQPWFEPEATGSELQYNTLPSDDVEFTSQAVKTLVQLVTQVFALFAPSSSTPATRVNLGSVRHDSEVYREE